jgi:hypothetical protein
MTSPPLAEGRFRRPESLPSRVIGSPNRLPPELLYSRSGAVGLGQLSMPRKDQRNIGNPRARLHLAQTRLAQGSVVTIDPMGSEWQFELHYQPLVNIHHKQVTGFEALLRWRHPDRGLVCSAEFISLAERDRPDSAHGEWVLRQACAEGR